MPNYLEYQKSIANEFKAYENRVRNLIDGAHWGEEGRYKEIILMNYLKRVLPKNVSVGTGFVRNKNKVTSQIDIIIYDNTFPVLFSEGDFVIATPKNVIGIVEVKTRIELTKLSKIIEKANKNANIICGDNKCKSIFNGIFSFNSDNNPKRISDNNIVKKSIYDLFLKRSRHLALLNCVNNIAWGRKYFIKLWHDKDDNKNSYYNVYEMRHGLAFSYFFSNLQEFVLKVISGYQPIEMKSFFYPIPEGKEKYVYTQIELPPGIIDTIND